MTEPLTSAGQALAAALAANGAIAIPDARADWGSVDLDAVAESMANRLPGQAAALDVERLDRAMAAVGIHAWTEVWPAPTREVGCRSCQIRLPAIAREYAALAEPEGGAT